MSHFNIFWVFTISMRKDKYKSWHQLKSFCQMSVLQLWKTVIVFDTDGMMNQFKINLQTGNHTNKVNLFREKLCLVTFILCFIYMIPLPIDVIELWFTFATVRSHPSGIAYTSVNRMTCATVWWTDSRTVSSIQSFTANLKK